MNDSPPILADRLLAADWPAQPYPGLRPFEMEEWPIFFGRERMIDEVVEMLGRHRLVIVHGSSGSGKSSLIRAGVLPRLARQHLRHGVPWRTAAMRPAGSPLWNLAAALATIEVAEADLARIEAVRRAFDRPVVRLQQIVAEDLGLAGQHACILVDQFEELFRYERDITRDEAQLFIELLVGLLNDVGETAVHTVVTMRSEFLGECARYDGLAEAINRCQYLLPRMDGCDLSRAIRRPAELYGGAVEEALAERLIAEGGGGQDELPLIQHALMLLWQEAATDGRTPPRLGLHHYRDKAGGIAALLSDHADAVMAGPRRRSRGWLIGSRQRVVELMFRALTDITSGGQGVRRPQRFDRLAAVTGCDRTTLRAIIDAFRAEGVSLLTPYPPKPIEDATVIDISHEALIRCWRRIADHEDGWLQQESRDGRYWRQLLETDFTPGLHALLTASEAERLKKLTGYPPAWCERYGGGWQRLSEVASADKAAKKKLRQFFDFCYTVMLFSFLYAVYNCAEMSVSGHISAWYVFFAVSQGIGLVLMSKFFEKICKTAGY